MHPASANSSLDHSGYLSDGRNNENVMYYPQQHHPRVMVNGGSGYMAANRGMRYGRITCCRANRQRPIFVLCFQT